MSGLDRAHFLVDVLLPNKRLKLAAPVVYGRIVFVNVKAWRRSLGASR